MDTPLFKGRLGYGCSRLMGGISRAESLQLLECAHAVGIRHFDVARSYGYGEAEVVLGQFLKGKRESVSITTKVGLKPMMATGLLGMARTLARKVTAVFPATRTIFRRGAATMVRKATLTPELVTASLQESLASLQTDYIDILLMHECEAGDLADGRVLDTLVGLRKRGLIRAFGVGASIDRTERVLQTCPGALDVVQVENNPGVRVFGRLPLSGGPLVLTHGSLGANYNAMCELLRGDPGFARQCSETTGFDVQDGRLLARSLVAYALAMNPQGGVLYSSRSSANIAANAELIQSSALTSEKCRGLERLFDLLETHLGAAPTLKGEKP